MRGITYTDKCILYLLKDLSFVRRARLHGILHILRLEQARAGRYRIPLYFHTKNNNSISHKLSYILDDLAFMKLVEIVPIKNDITYKCVTKLPVSPCDEDCYLIDSLILMRAHKCSLVRLHMYERQAINGTLFRDEI